MTTTEVQVREQAKASFVDQMQKKVKFIATGKCYGWRIRDEIMEMNELIEAARRLGATDIEPFKPEAIEKVAAELKDFHTLGMILVLSAHLHSWLWANGVSEDIVPGLVEE